MNCSPSSLANAARCFKSCIPQGDVQAVKSYLLCQIANVGLIGVQGPNLIPPGSMYPANLIFNLTVLTNTVYVIIWGSQEQSMTMGSETYVSGGAGTMTYVYTNGNTNMAFLGTNNGATVTVMVFAAPKATPIPGDFTFTVNSGGATATASWDAPPAGVSFTEFWTSTDGVTYNLAAHVNAPGTSATVTAPTSGNVLYGKARWKKLSFSAFTQPIKLTANANLLTSLQGYWNLNENIVSGARADSLGLNNLTDVNANVPSGAAGILGRDIVTAYLPGQRLNHADTPGLAAGAGVSWTLTAWVNYSLVVANVPIVCKWGPLTDFAMVTQVGTATFINRSTNLAAANIVSDSLVVPVALNWYFVAIGYDDSLQQIWVQVNAGARTSSACVGVQRTAASFTVANYDENNLQSTGGSTDEVAFWHRSLATSEITQLYNAGVGITYPFS